MNPPSSSLVSHCPDAWSYVAPRAETLASVEYEHLRIYTILREWCCEPRGTSIHELQAVSTELVAQRIVPTFIISCSLIMLSVIWSPLE